MSKTPEDAGKEMAQEMMAFLETVEVEAGYLLGDAPKRADWKELAEIWAIARITTPAIRTQRRATMTTEPTWTTKDGLVLRVSEMDDQHICNTIALLEKTAEMHCAQAVYCVLSLPYPRGEYAGYAFDAMADDVFESQPSDYLPDVYYDLVDERNKRQGEQR